MLLLKFFRIRIPAAAHAAIVVRAQKNHRSINAEIVAMLKAQLTEEN